MSVIFFFITGSFRLVRLDSVGSLLKKKRNTIARSFPGCLLYGNLFTTYHYYDYYVFKCNLTNMINASEVRDVFSITFVLALYMLDM